MKCDRVGRQQYGESPSKRPKFRFDGFPSLDSVSMQLLLSVSGQTQEPHTHLEIFHGSAGNMSAVLYQGSMRCDAFRFIRFTVFLLYPCPFNILSDCFNIMCGFLGDVARALAAWTEKGRKVKRWERERERERAFQSRMGIVQNITKYCAIIVRDCTVYNYGLRVERGGRMGRRDRETEK